MDSSRLTKTTLTDSKPTLETTSARRVREFLLHQLDWSRLATRVNQTGVNMIDKPNGARVRRLRTSAGLSQVDLAEMVSIPATSMSKIENDRHPFDDTLVASLSAQLGCRPQLLSRPNPEMLYTKPWLRAYADASKKLV